MSTTTGLTELRGDTVQTLRSLLDIHSLDELNKSHNLYYKTHSNFDIAILHYGKSAHTNKTSNFDSCRGLVVELTPPFKIVSRGFDRFTPKQEDLKTTLNVKKVTVKEDGSMMMMFKYDDKWMLSTMYDFADGPLAFSEKTYAELFMQIINQPLDDFANNLVDQFPNSNDIMTICFEMCSLENRVIKPYETPTLFLTSVYGSTDGNTEFDIPSGIVLCPNVNVVDQVEFPQTLTVAEAYARVNEIAKSSQSNLMFEGVVVQTIDGKRIKIKNSYYYTHHYLKYKGWTKCSPEIMVPLIIKDLDEQIITNVIESCPHDRELVGRELRKRRDYYKHIMNLELEKIKLAVSTVMTNSENNSMQVKNYAEALKQCDTNLFTLWSGLFFALFKNKFDYNEYPKYFESNIKRVFDKSDPFLSTTHCKHCCEFTNDYATTIANNINQLDPLNGRSTDPYMCHCGSPMKLTELRTELHRYMSCHCGENYGYLTYGCWTNIMLCTDPLCTCTHEVNTHTQKPLGLPASDLCKSLRLEIHEIMNSSGLSKDVCYDIIQKLIGRSKDETHMAKFNIDDCLKVLISLQSEINEVYIARIMQETNAPYETVKRAYLFRNKDYDLAYLAVMDSFNAGSQILQNI